MRQRQKSILCFMILVGALLNAAGSFTSQAQDAIVETQAVARQLDEFGIVGGCDSGARLDNLVIELQNQPNVKGYIICYGPPGEGSGTAARVLDSARDYLVNSRGIDPERILTINGGRYTRGEIKTELWVVPENATAPEPTQTLTNTLHVDFAGRFGEYQTYDSLVIGEGVGGISFGNVTLASFADVLRQQPASRAHLIAYAALDESPGAPARISRREVAEFLRGYNIEANRVTGINGGRGERTRIELWILPKDAPPPVVEAGEEIASNAAMIGSFEQYVLRDEHNSAWARNSLADMLRSDRQTQGCIIIRLPHPRENSEHSDETSLGTNDALPNEPSTREPDLDLQQLAERWKREIAERHNIEPHRITVMIGRSSEWETGTVETWIVPRGAAMPDPNALREDEISNETGEETEDSTSGQEPTVNNSILNLPPPPPPPA